MKRLISLLPALLITACNKPQSTQTATPTPLSTATLTDWPITRGGPTLQGRVIGPVLERPAIEWTFQMDSPGTAEAAVAEGAIVVGDVTGFVYCIDFESRKLRWKHETGDTIQAAPAIANGRIFVGSGDHKFYALDLRSGETIWSIDGSDKFSSAPIIVASPDATAQWILVNGYDGITRCLLASDGSIVWTYKSDDFINGTPAVIDGRFVAFGGCDKVIHILNLADGKVINEVVADSQITNSVATFGTTIYCGNHANQVTAAEAEGPALTWIHEGGDFPFFTAPAVDDRHVYIGCRDKSLHAIHRSNGKLAWTFPTGGRIESSPIAFNDAVVFGSSDGRLYAVNPTDGKERWRLDLGEDLSASPVYAQGRIIIAGGEGTVFIIADSSSAKQP